MARAVRRPRLRRRGRAGRARARDRPQRPRLPEVRGAVRAGLVGLGRLHVLLGPLRHGRPRLPPADDRRDARRRRARLDDARRAPRRLRRLRALVRRGAGRADRPLPARLPARAARPRPHRLVRGGVQRERIALARVAPLPYTGALLDLGVRARPRPRHAARRSPVHPVGAGLRDPHPGADRPVHDHRARRVRLRGRRRDDRHRLERPRARRGGRRLRRRGGDLVDLLRHPRHVTVQARPARRPDLPLHAPAAARRADRRREPAWSSRSTTSPPGR